MKADSSVKSGTYTFELADNAIGDKPTWREVTLQVGSMQTETAIPTAIPTVNLLQTTVKKNNNIDADIIANAENYKILLDTKVKVLDTVNLNQGTYYIVEYSNLLPYASGIEVISSSGEYVKDSDIVDPVFASSAWKTAAGQLTSSDIQTLKEVLQTSQSIDSTISPVLSDRLVKECLCGGSI